MCVLVLTADVAKYCVCYTDGGTSYEDYMEKHSRAGQATDSNMAHAHYLLDN
jgi:hypothetical protein